jgi:oxygen-independent coproporphyrinogen-3 oxidase
VKIVPTAYIGGGTPSILGAGGLARLLSGLRSLWGKPPVEITLEVNPESAGEALLRAAREGGVTRISLGVQSFHGPSRRAVGRAGEEELLHSRLRLVQEIFPGAYSADLIAGLPVQSWAVLLRDLETLLAYEPAHVSLYALTVEEGTPLEGRVKRDRTLLPSPEEADRIWLAGRDFLEAAGYGQYEVSNFALPGKRSLHNIRYWRMKNWLGIGPSASGTLIDEETGSGWRLTQRPSTESWLAPGPLPEPEREFLDPLTLMKESLLMGFRYVEGPGGERFKNRFGRSLSASIPRTRAAWEKRGFFAPPGRGAGLRPSREGLLFLDAFLRDAFAELDTTG